MGNIKTAISIEKPLFEQIEDLAHELNTSRSRVFALAAEEFVQRHKNQKLLEAINAAYDEDLSDAAETSRKSLMQSRHREMVKNQW
jgi:metal-responsive CopG/Arc/MetJ family transcriptional regulator